MVTECSDYRNTESRCLVPNSVADTDRGKSDNRPMDQVDWHLQAWMNDLGKIQADMIRDLGWTRRKASEIYNGEQPYKRETVNELAVWLNIKPYELLMPPEEAVKLRQLREAAFAIVANHPTPPTDQKAS